MACLSVLLHLHTHVYCLKQNFIFLIISCAFRYSEFYRLNQELRSTYPNLRFPPFPKKIIFGRSQVHNVADKRMVELQTYLQVIHDAMMMNDFYYHFCHCTGNSVISRDHCWTMSLQLFETNH